MKIPPRIVYPYCDVSLSRPELQEELLDLATNEELKPSSNEGYRKLEIEYPSLWNIASKFIAAFPSSHLVERASSTVTDLITEKRNSFDIAHSVI